MFPTSHLRYIRRDTGTPCLVLQQWWSSFGGHVSTPVLGEWRDVPIVEPVGVPDPRKAYVVTRIEFDPPITVRSDEVLEFDPATRNHRVLKAKS